MQAKTSAIERKRRTPSRRKRNGKVLNSNKLTSLHNTHVKRIKRRKNEQTSTAEMSWEGAIKRGRHLRPSPKLGEIACQTGKEYSSKKKKGKQNNEEFKRSKPNCDGAKGMGSDVQSECASRDLAHEETGRWLELQNTMRGTAKQM